MLDCEQLDTIFAMSEQKVTRNLIRKKIVAANVYYGKIKDDEAFPLHSGTRIKGFRLGRIGVPDCTGWRPVEDTLCSTNACSFEPDVISHGHSDYFFSLVQKDLRTDWLCLDSLSLREMPDDEIAHLEDGLQSAARYVHEEFRRSRFLLFGRNKLVTLVAADENGDPSIDSQTCDDSETVNNGYVFEVRANGEMDECHVRVCVLPSKVAFISELTLDQLDYATERLQYEGDDTMMNQIGLHDVILPGQRIANQLALQENALMDHAVSYRGGSFDLLELRQTFGTERVIRNYSLRSDIHAMRFYVDSVFNSANDIDDDDFDQNNPNTWPRFQRVFAYIPIKSAVAGIEFKTNPDYLRAQFGIATILTPRVMDVMSFPNTVRVGGAARVGGFGYEGTAQWQNPDWQCNVNRDKGFWKMRFRLAARPQRDEEGYSWFIRLNNKRALRGNDCALVAAPCQEDVTPYCFEGMGGSVESELGTNASIDN